MAYVTAYDVSREYGGPEEGGWWFDLLTGGRPIAGPLAEDDAIDLARSMNTAASEDRDGPDRFSVLGGVEPAYVVEDTLGERETRERPRYE